MLNISADILHDEADPLRCAAEELVRSAPTDAFPTILRADISRVGGVNRRNLAYAQYDKNRNVIGSG